MKIYQILLYDNLTGRSFVQEGMFRTEDQALENIKEQAESVKAYDLSFALIYNDNDELVGFKFGNRFILKVESKELFV